MKKIIACLLASFMMIFMFTGCADKSNTTQKGDTDKLSIVCTIFPEYDWVKQILGKHFDNADVTMLLDNGVDLHNYQPTTDDIVKVSSCDVFIYVGGESDAWVKDALKEATNKNMIVINLLDVLGDTIKEEEVVEGMEAEEDEQEESKDSKDEGPEYDEHVWLSLNNTKSLVKVIADKIGKADKTNANDYKENADKYIDKLEALNNEYKDVVKTAKQKTVLFGDRFPFRYLVDDYGLSYYAAFVGCSAETEASFKTVAFLAKKVDELKLGSVLTIEGAKHKIAETIVKNTKDKNQQILTLNSMQSTTSKDVKNGTTYLSIMTDNLEVLKKALN